MQKPFVPKKRTFAFPNPERMGQRVLEIVGLTHGYGDRRLFDDVSLEMEKGERVALIGERPEYVRLTWTSYAEEACCGTSAWNMLCSGCYGQGQCMRVYAHDCQYPQVLTAAVMLYCRPQWLREEHIAAAGHGPGEAHLGQRQPGPAPHPAQLL